MTWMLLTLPLVGCQVGDHLAMSSNEQSVQWDAMSGQFEVAPFRATGALRSTMYDANHNPRYDETGKYPLRGTCGVTFISPHYAVTAAHCVGSETRTDPETDTVTVEQYDVSGVDPDDLKSAGGVQGFFPDYQRVLKLESDFPNAHYAAWSYECSVVARCNHPNLPTGAAYNCNVERADVALLYCPDRSNTDRWIRVASSDYGTGHPVEMYWFHEVLLMPLQSDPSDPALEDRFDHYTTRTSDPADNFHYLEADANLVLPLKSARWDPALGGAWRSRLGIDPITEGYWTDLFGCHGTSGSGVLQRNEEGEFELLGPAVRGSDDWAYDRLCKNPDGFSPGDNSLSYTSNTKTRALETLFESEIDDDRSEGGPGSCECTITFFENQCMGDFGGFSMGVDHCNPGFHMVCNPSFQNPPSTVCGGCTCE